MTLFPRQVQFSEQSSSRNVVFGWNIEKLTSLNNDTMDLFPNVGRCTTVHASCMGKIAEFKLHFSLTCINIQIKLEVMFKNFECESE